MGCEAEGEMQMSSIQLCRIFRSTSFTALLLCAWMIGMVTNGWAQEAQIAHFVAPSYPPLARQAMISGQVILQLTVDAKGAVKDTSVIAKDGSPHPLLVQEAKQCIQEWKFHASANEHKVVGVVFYFGFSGTTRESNHRTRVTADFEGGAVRVFITTDGVRTIHP